MFRLKVIILPFFEPGLMQVRGHYFVDSHGRALGEIPLGQCLRTRNLRHREASVSSTKLTSTWLNGNPDMSLQSTIKGSAKKRLCEKCVFRKLLADGERIFQWP